MFSMGKKRSLHKLFSLVIYKKLMENTISFTLKNTVLVQILLKLALLQFHTVPNLTPGEVEYLIDRPV